MLNISATISLSRLSVHFTVFMKENTLWTGVIKRPHRQQLFPLLHQFLTHMLEHLFHVGGVFSTCFDEQKVVVVGELFDVRVRNVSFKVTLIAYQHL